MSFECTILVLISINKPFSNFGDAILIPEAVLLLVKTKNQDLERSNFLSMRRVILSYSQPIRFVTVRLDSEHAESDGRAVNHGCPVLDLPGGLDSCC